MRFQSGNEFETVAIEKLSEIRHPTASDVHCDSFEQKEKICLTTGYFYPNNVEATRVEIYNQLSVITSIHLVCGKSVDTVSFAPNIPTNKFVCLKSRSIK